MSEQPISTGDDFSRGVAQVREWRRRVAERTENMTLREVVAHQRRVAQESLRAWGLDLPILAPKTTPT